MFWRSFLSQASRIDTILRENDVSLERLLDEDELLQELKGNNSGLLDFLTRESTLRQLFEYMTPPPSDDAEFSQFEASSALSSPEDFSNADDERLKKKYRKYPGLCSEVICCEVDRVLRASLPFLSSYVRTLLGRSSAIPSAYAGIFSRVVTTFLSRFPDEVLSLAAAPVTGGSEALLNRLIEHIGASAMSLLVVKMMNVSYFSSIQPPSDVAGNGNLGFGGNSQQYHEERMKVWVDCNVLRRLCGRLMQSTEDPMGYDLDDVHDSIVDVVGHVFQYFADAAQLKSQVDTEGLLHAATDFPLSAAADLRAAWTSRYLPLLPVLTLYATHAEQFASTLGRVDDAFAAVFRGGDFSDDDMQRRRVGRFRVATAEFVSSVVQRYPDASMGMFSKSVRTVLDLFFVFDRCSILHAHCTSICRAVLSSPSNAQQMLFGEDALLERFMREYEPNSGRGNMGHMTLLLNAINDSMATLMVSDAVCQQWSEFVESKLQMQNQKQSGTLGGPVPDIPRSLSGAATMEAVGLGGALSALTGGGATPMDIDVQDDDDDDMDLHRGPLRSLGLAVPIVSGIHSGAANLFGAASGLGARAVVSSFESDSDEDSDEGDDAARHLAAGGGSTASTGATTNASFSPASSSESSFASTDEDWAKFEDTNFS